MKVFLLFNRYLVVINKNSTWNSTIVALPVNDDQIL